MQVRSQHVLIAFRQISRHFGVGQQGDILGGQLVVFIRLEHKFQIVVHLEMNASVAQRGAAHVAEAPVILKGKPRQLPVVQKELRFHIHTVVGPGEALQIDHAVQPKLAEKGFPAPIIRQAVGRESVRMELDAQVKIGAGNGAGIHGPFFGERGRLAQRRCGQKAQGQQQGEGTADSLTEHAVPSFAFTIG